MKTNDDELLSAILAKDRQKLEELCDSGIRMHWPLEPSGVLPLVYAAKSGDLDFCKFFMDLTPNSVESVLINAINFGFTEILETLISLGFDANEVDYYNFNDGSCLHFAVSKLNFDAVQILLEAGADINQADNRGTTPIHCVCKKFDSSCNLNRILDYFLLRPHLKPKPNLNPVNEKGDTPLLRAAINKNIDAVNRLIKEGVDVDYISGDDNNMAIQYAIESGSEEILLSLLRAGCALNMRSGYHDETPLSCAASANNVAFCQILMEYGAEIKAEDHLLHEVAENKNPDMIDFFLKEGLSVNAQAHDGITPLMYVARNSAVACKLLIQRDARMDLVDKRGKTAFDYCFEDLTCKNTAVYLIIEGSPRSELSYKTAEKSSDELRVLLLRFLLLTEISPLMTILDRMEHKTRCIEEFQQMASRPHSLKHFCRLNIREVLIQHSGGRGILSSVEKLPLPPSIQSYLGYEKELQEAQLSLFYDEDEDIPSPRSVRSASGCASDSDSDSDSYSYSSESDKWYYH